MKQNEFSLLHEIMAGLLVLLAIAAVVIGLCAIRGCVDTPRMETKLDIPGNKL